MPLGTNKRLKGSKLTSLGGSTLSEQEKRLMNSLERVNLTDPKDTHVHLGGPPLHSKRHGNEMCIIS